MPKRVTSGGSSLGGQRLDNTAPQKRHSRGEHAVGDTVSHLISLEIEDKSYCTSSSYSVSPTARHRYDVSVLSRR